VAEAASLVSDSPRVMATSCATCRGGCERPITEGLDSAPAILMGLPKGANFGKQLVRIGPNVRAISDPVNRVPDLAA
jgi:NADPH-dependent curcumin reductase CurA